MFELSKWLISAFGPPFTKAPFTSEPGNVKFEVGLVQ